MKTIHLCEAHGVRLEVHGGGPGNLTCCAPWASPGSTTSAGCCTPSSTTTPAPPWLNAPTDPMDEQGMVHVPQVPGLGWDFNWDYIREHRLPS